MAKGYPLSDEALDKILNLKNEGMTYQHIAAQVGISYALLNFLRRGDRKVGLSTALKLSAALEMPPEKVVHVS